MPADVEVLLPAYNGEEFLAEQIDSVLAQRNVELTVLARDDGSDDRTPDLLQHYARKFPGRFVVGKAPGRLGPPGNVNWLLGQSSAPYVAFCDQDNVWRPDKLHTLLERARAAERRLGGSTPVLVHSDLEVVNQDLEVVHPSFWRHSGAAAPRSRLAQLLVSNTVTGCASLANRSLVELATPLPPEAIMHDHWLALVAAAFGHIEPVPRALVAYRQHGGNVVGARATGWPGMLRRLLSGRGRKDIRPLQRQAAAFGRRFADRLDAGQLALVKGFADLQTRGWVRRRVFLVRHGILRAGVARNLVLLFFARMIGDGNRERPSDPWT